MPADRSIGGDDVQGWRHDACGLGRHAPISLVLALLLALAGGTAAGPPPPSPEAPNAALAAKAKALQAKLDAQHAEVERLAERLNATDDRRRRLQASLGRLKARQAAAQAELDAAQAQLDEQARATYMGGPQWMLGELVGGANPSDAMRRIPMQKAALEARAAVVTDVRVRKAEVDSLNERLAADLAEADLVHQRQDDERRQVQRLVDPAPGAPWTRSTSSSPATWRPSGTGPRRPGGPPGPATCRGSGRSSPGSRPARWPGRPSAGPWPSSATPTAGAPPAPTPSTARG